MKNYKNIVVKLLIYLYKHNKILLMVSFAVLSKPAFCQSEKTIEKEVIVNQNTSNNKIIVTRIDELAQFVGGKTAMYNWIARKIKYPQLAAESTIQGVVIVSFVIELDGKISDIKINRGLGFGCDEEVIRIIKLMPKWVPAKFEGKPVVSRFTMPISFSINSI